MDPHLSLSNNYDWMQSVKLQRQRIIHFKKIKCTKELGQPFLKQGCFVRSKKRGKNYYGIYFLKSSLKFNFFPKKRVFFSNRRYLHWSPAVNRCLRGESVKCSGTLTNTFLASLPGSTWWHRHLRLSRAEWGDKCVDYLPVLLDCPTAVRRSSLPCKAAASGADSLKIPGIFLVPWSNGQIVSE